MAQSQTSSWNLPGGTKKNNEKLSVRVVICSTKFATRNSTHAVLPSRPRCYVISYTIKKNTFKKYIFRNSYFLKIYKSAQTTCYVRLFCFNISFTFNYIFKCKIFLLYTMKARRGNGVYFHSFLTLALNGVMVSFTLQPLAVGKKRPH